MEYLYVCRFSNGHIKVGRSIDPDSRVASHSERVACMGIKLLDHRVYQCDGSAGPAETKLIAQCNEHCDERFLEEWFSGLAFVDVCGWAADAATKRLESPDYSRESKWRSMLADLKRVGMTQMQIAALCDCDQSTISALSNGRAEEPRHSLGEKIIAIHREKVGL